MLALTYLFHGWTRGTWDWCPNLYHGPMITLSLILIYWIILSINSGTVYGNYKITPMWFLHTCCNTLPLCSWSRWSLNRYGSTIPRNREAKKKNGRRNISVTMKKWAPKAKGLGYGKNKHTKMGSSSFGANFFLNFDKVVDYFFAQRGLQTFILCILKYERL